MVYDYMYELSTYSLDYNEDIKNKPKILHVHFAYSFQVLQVQLNKKYNGCCHWF